jgi:UDP-N-acetylmuramoyl-tripeptide--D-alanyl-D-alanine ligase
MTLAVAKDLLARSGQLVADRIKRGDEAVTGASIDTRADCKGRIFFALKGERVDGHDYVSSAFERGALAVVVERDDPVRTESGASYFLVKDTLASLQRLAGGYRRMLPARVIAVTGSSGKTTTKELIARVLALGHRVYANPGNYNNHIGVPLTILDASGEDDYLVSELGANHPGEIRFLCGILAPHVGIVTQIGEAHIGFFGGRREVALAKAELLENLPPEGTAVLPRDDEFFDLLARRCNCRVVTYGFSRGSDYVVDSYRLTEDGSEFSVSGTRMKSRFLGIHNARNAAAVIALADLEGIERDEAAEAMASVSPLEGRGRLLRGGGVTVIDDAYNANPSSMQASLEVLSGMPASRRVAVLGDMKELGAFSDEYHEALGRFAALMELDLLFWLGEEADAVRSGMEGAGGACRFEAFHTLGSLRKALGTEVGKGDVVLVKGSHSCRLDEIVGFLIDRLNLEVVN